MKRRTRTEITFETDELLIIRHRENFSRVRCSVCDGGTMITLEEAILLAGVSSRVIHRWAEAGQIHFVETAGIILICLDALLARLDDKWSRQIQPPPGLRPGRR